MSSSEEPPRSGNPSQAGFCPLAPVQTAELHGDAISHSLAVLSTVYHYNHWIFDSIRDHLGEHIVEVGSGVGNISQFLLNAEQLVCLEPYRPYREYLAKRFSRHQNVSVVEAPIEGCPRREIPAGAFDSVVCLNVLEHIADDVAALKIMGDLLVPGGRVVILVPAMPWAFGAMDAAMGHLRRHTMHSLTARFRRAGLAVETAKYLNFPGLFGWWWQGRILGREKLSQAATRAFDRVVPYVSAIERLIPVPVGQSLLAVGRREVS